ncbi:hypothetical protein [Streptomyces sp. TP-A0356]|uniref:hypothetical protein n=1 Tax=Streptomyces sp. TP-A0356 TaxID=1359208 RepID=UPI0006E36C67|nr:hypothetical protein [Streptomyces sp. TP-A0356]
MRAADIIDPDRYTVYSNAPLELPKEDRQKAEAALLELLDEQETDASARGETDQRDPSDDEGNAGRDLWTGTWSRARPLQRSRWAQRFWQRRWPWR